MPVVPPQPSTHYGSSSGERLYQRLQFRQDTLANWLRADPILASGEMGYVIGATAEDRRLKVGDGTRRWSELPWVASRGPSGPVGPQGPQGPGPTVFQQSTAPAASGLKDGDIWIDNSTGSARLYVRSGNLWVAVSSSSSGAAIVSEVTPADPGEIGSLWIRPSELQGDISTTDVLAAIRGQVIAPKAIDLDGPNTLYIAQDADGSVKLSIRADSAKGSRLDSFFATEDWVLANAPGLYVGTTPPGNINTTWINPEGAGGGIAPTVEPPFVVSEVAPLTTSTIWINPKGVSESPLAAADSRPFVVSETPPTNFFGIWINPQG